MSEIMTLHIGTDRVDGQPVIIPNAILKKHVAIVGDTGYGKTVALKVFIEEANMQGIPSVIMDPHGDLSEFARPFDHDMIKKMGGDIETCKKFEDSVEVRIWTPVRSKGLPLCLNPFVPPHDNEDSEIMASSWDLMAAGFTGIAGFNLSKPEGVEIKGYLVSLLQYASAMDILPSNFYELADLVEKPVLVRKTSGLNAIDFDARIVDLITNTTREKLARRFRVQETGVNHLMFTLGTALDFDVMCTPCDPKKTPLNIIYMNTLGSDDIKQNFMLEVGRRLYDWTTRQKCAKEEVKLIFAVDEVHNYIPPYPKNPPAKSILARLSAEGRKFGLSCIFATQNIKSVDYKIMGQASTLCVGKYKEPNNIKAVKNVLSEISSDTSAMADELPKLKEGQFQVVCNDVFDEPQPVKIRWLYSRHGDGTLSEDDVERFTTDAMRACVGNLGSGIKMSQSKSFQENIEEQKLLDSAEDELSEEISSEEIDHESHQNTNSANEDEIIDIDNQEFEMNLLGGFSLFKDGRDPLSVMLGITNILTTFVLLWASYGIASHTINNDSSTVTALISLGISMLAAGVLLSEILADGELSVIRKIRNRARPLQYLSLIWLWILWAILISKQIDLPYLIVPIEVVQTMMTAFVILEIGHRIRIGRIDWPEAGTLGEWAKGSLKSLTTMVQKTELETLRATSKELLYTFRLTMDGLIIVTLLLLINGYNGLEYFSSENWLVRILAIYVLLFASQLLVSFRNKQE